MRLAILGAGLAARIHSKALQAAPGVERWYASRDDARGRASAARFKGTGHFASYESALASPHVDTVLVALPPALHLDWTLRAFEAGKHVVVEKPPFLTTVDFSRAVSAADRAGRQLLVGENYFYKPLTVLLRTVVRQGDLGEVRFIHVNALKRQSTGDWRDDASLTGGGALFEGGIHWISLLANVGLTPVRARAARVGGGSGLERNTLVTLEYGEGAAAALSYSWDLPSAINGLRVSRVYGTAGTLRFETNGLAALLWGRRKRVLVPGLMDLTGHRAMWLDFLSAIAENRPPAYHSALAMRDLRLVEDAYASLNL